MFGSPGSGVKEFYGQDPLVAFDFAVVSGCVGADPLVTGPAEDFGEVVGPVAGAVIGDDAVDVADPVDPPATTVGDPADLLHIDMHHMSWPSSHDPARCPVVLTRGIEEPTPVQPQMGELTGHRPHRDRGAFTVEFERDPSRRPLVDLAQPLDPGDDRGGSRCRLPMGCRGSVEQVEFAVPAPPVDPLGGALARDPHLGGDVSDRTVLAALDEAATALDEQWGVALAGPGYTSAEGISASVSGGGVSWMDSLSQSLQSTFEHQASLVAPVAAPVIVSNSDRRNAARAADQSLTVTILAAMHSVKVPESERNQFLTYSSVAR